MSETSKYGPNHITGVDDSPWNAFPVNEYVSIPKAINILWGTIIDASDYYHNKLGDIVLNVTAYHSKSEDHEWLLEVAIYENNKLVVMYGYNVPNDKAFVSMVGLLKSKLRRGYFGTMNSPDYRLVFYDGYARGVEVTSDTSSDTPGEVVRHLARIKWRRIPIRISTDWWGRITDAYQSWFSKAAPSSPPSSGYVYSRGKKVVIMDDK